MQPVDWRGFPCCTAWFLSMHYKDFSCISYISQCVYYGCTWDLDYVSRMLLLKHVLECFKILRLISLVVNTVLIFALCGMAAGLKVVVFGSLLPSFVARTIFVITAGVDFTSETPLKGEGQHFILLPENSNRRSDLPEIAFPVWRFHLIISRPVSWIFISPYTRPCLCWTLIYG